MSHCPGSRLNTAYCLLQEMEAKDIEIPNISWKVFELMIRYSSFFVCQSWMYKCETKMWKVMSSTFRSWTCSSCNAHICTLCSCNHRCIYTGAVEVTTDVAQDLLRAADQYLLEGLKTVMRVCYSPGQFHESYLTCSSNLIKGQEVSL